MKAKRVSLWIALGLIAVAAMLALLGDRIARYHVSIQLESLNAGLTACYNAIGTENPSDVIPPDKLAGIIRNDLNAGNDERHLLPSFVSPADVYFAEHPALHGSDAILCAVRIGKSRFYALKANGKYATVNQAAMDTWDHTR